ncbi:ABC transporter permease [Eisenbergiella sp.]
MKHEKTVPYKKKALKEFGRELWKQRELQLMVVPALIALLLFSLFPLFGLQIAFKDYKMNSGIIGSAWVGLKHFKAFFTDPNVMPVLWNTIGLSVIKAFFTIPLPIIFALLLNEVTHTHFKKLAQTISYFPYFLSWSVISLMAITWLSPQNGFINGFLTSTGILEKPYFFLGEPKAFWGISIALDIWKNLGYSSIIYLAAMSNVDQEVTEAAVVDGAGRLRRIIHVTMPAILPTVMILLIINIGNLLRGGSNFDISYNLMNSLNQPRAEILDTYVLKTGISMARFSYATAIGLLQSVVASVLLISANAISKATTGESYF